jgi:hypothetical protein
MGGSGPGGLVPAPELIVSNRPPFTWRQPVEQGNRWSPTAVGRAAPSVVGERGRPTLRRGREPPVLPYRGAAALKYRREPVRLCTGHHQPRCHSKRCRVMTMIKGDP